MSFGNNPHVNQGKAASTITPFSIVRSDGNDLTMELAGDNETVMGIGPDYSVATGVNFPFATGGVAQVKLGGTVSAGGKIKSDASGFGVAVATTGTVNQNSIGTARLDGVSGDIIPVQIDIETIRPALT